MTNRKTSFKIKLAPSSSCDGECDYLARFPIVARMDDLASRNFDYTSISPTVVAALKTAGIKTYGDLYRAPQVELGGREFQPGRCLEDVRGLGAKSLKALLDNLMGFGWDYQDSVKPVRAAACSAVDADDFVSEEYVEPTDDRDPADRERTIFFDVDGNATDDIDAALTSVKVIDGSPSSYTGIVEVYAADGTTLFTHEYEWYPAGRDVPALDDEGFMNEARSALEHMFQWATGEKSTVLVDHISDSVWHVAAPGTPGLDAAKDIDGQNSAEPRRYYTADLDENDNGYDVHLVPVAVAQDLAGMSKRDTALVNLFERTEQIHFTDADDRDEDEA